MRQMQMLLPAVVNATEPEFNSTEAETELNERNCWKNAKAVHCEKTVQKLITSLPKLLI